ncbi:hypothetical protein Tco_0753129 [Tanacetum coccineum]
MLNFLQRLKLNCLQLDLHLGDFMFKSTKRLKGSGTDPNSSDNFIQHRVTKHVGLPTKPSKTFQLNPLTDIILGAAWLATFGPHIADYSSATIKFYLDKKVITLTDTTPNDTLQLPDMVPYDLATVLHGFASVFAVPTGLPPSRTQDHSIVLHEGVNAVKIHLYRYPVCQTAQIETMVADMLTEGLIKPSTSPFSALVLLVRKKDEDWLYAKLSNCAFGQQHIEYLSHIVMGSGVEVDPAKVTDVANWPIPTFVSQLCAFFRLTRIYGVSVPALTKDYKWNEDQYAVSRGLNTLYLEDSIRRIQDMESI